MLPVFERPHTRYLHKRFQHFTQTVAFVEEDEKYTQNEAVKYNTGNHGAEEKLI
jgi:hypothetical protein